MKYYVDLLERTRRTPEWQQYVRQNELVEEWMTGDALAAFIDAEEKLYSKINQEMTRKQ